MSLTSCMLYSQKRETVFRMQPRGHPWGTALEILPLKFCCLHMSGRQVCPGVLSQFYGPHLSPKLCLNYLLVGGHLPVTAPWDSARCMGLHMGGCRLLFGGGLQTKVSWHTLFIIWYLRQRLGIKVQSCLVLR